MPRLSLLRSALLALLLVYTAFLTTGPDEGTRLVLADGLYLLIALLVAGLSVGHAWAARRRSAWVLAGAFGALTLAEAWMLQYDFPGRESPDFSVADPLYVAYYLGMIAVLLGLQRQRVTGAAAWGGLLDSLLVVLVAGEIAWIVFLKEVMVDPASSPLLRGLNLLYVVLDLLMLGLALLTMRRHTAPGLLLFGVGVLAYVAADFQYFALQMDDRYQAGHLLDALWAWGTALQAVTMLWVWERPAEAELSLETRLTPIQRVLLALPYLAVVATCALLWNSGHPALQGKDVPQWTVVIFLTVMVRQALTLLEREELTLRLHTQAFTDALTGLGNRAAFDQAMRKLGPEPQPAALIFLDLNGFKPLNDTLGHEAGDHALREVGRRLQEAVPVGAQIFRLGGDEFTVLLRGMSEDEARQTLPLLRGAVARPLTLAAGRWTLTASVGLAYAEDGSHADAEALRRDADHEMYSEKRASRAERRRTG